MSSSFCDLVTSAHLREAAATPDAPFSVKLDTETRLRLVRPLRVLPGRRYVGEAWLDGTHLLAKLFVSSSSARHCAREVKGITQLRRAGIPTPELVAHGHLPDGGHYVLTRFVSEAESFLSRWHRLLDESADKKTKTSALRPIFALLGRMHHAGLTHDDLHLGNFLIDGRDYLLIDGDAIRGDCGNPASTEAALRNIGMLVAQLPVWAESLLPELLSEYTRENPGLGLGAASVRSAIDSARSTRWRDYAAKLRRNCTHFSFERTQRRVLAVERSLQDELKPILDDPDYFIAEGMPLKLGRTATVAVVSHGSRRWVVKRYNIKDALHALTRAPRPTRAWRSWVEGHRLQSLGIETAVPRAVIESRFGPLRGRAWLISDFIPGVPLTTRLNPEVPPDAETADALIALFQSLARCKITHGDLKATNLIWHEGRIHMIDLDATTQHRSEAAFHRAWVKDRARLLRNWPEGSKLETWLDRNLPLYQRAQN